MQGLARRVIKRLLLNETPELEAYQRLASRGFKPAGIIDVGAYHGDWTRLARRVYPSTPTLMIEAQTDKAPLLAQLCSEMPSICFKIALLGSASGQSKTFFQMETGSSMLSEQSNVARDEHILTTSTLDEVAAAISGPLFLKIDVQGAELLVLEGGPRTLACSEVVQLEVALLAYNQGAPTFLETLTYMDRSGFVPFDLIGFIRPKGSELAQVDILFVQRESPLRPTFFDF